MSQSEAKTQRAKVMIIAYPIVVVLIAALINVFIFDVKTAQVGLPSDDQIVAIVVASVLLVANHTWLMTTTELCRADFGMSATPEEWAASGNNPQNIPKDGLRELERRHNIHRNTTENTVYFVLLSLVFLILSPPVLAVQVWIIGFALARLGYTYSYLAGRDSLRGFFMTLGLLATYGIASYLAMSLFV